MPYVEIPNVSATHTLPLSTDPLSPPELRIPPHTPSHPHPLHPHLSGAYDATHFSLLTPHSSLLTPHSSLLSARCSLLTPHCSLLTPHSSPLTTHHSPLAAHLSPLTTRCSPSTSRIGTLPGDLRWFRCLDDAVIRICCERKHVFGLTSPQMGMGQWCSQCPPPAPPPVAAAGAGPSAARERGSPYPAFTAASLAAEYAAYVARAVQAGRPSISQQEYYAWWKANAHVPVVPAVPAVPAAAAAGAAAAAAAAPAPEAGLEGQGVGDGQEGRSAQKRARPAPQPRPDSHRLPNVHVPPMMSEEQAAAHQKRYV